LPNLIAEVNETLWQAAMIADQNGGKVWERQTMEMKSLIF